MITEGGQYDGKVSKLWKTKFKDLIKYFVDLENRQLLGQGSLNPGLSTHHGKRQATKKWWRILSFREFLRFSGPDGRSRDSTASSIMFLEHLS
jgi:hypothetical protein